LNTTGCKCFVEHYLDGKRTGKQYEWYQNGICSNIRHWSNGKLHGEQKGWNNNGTLSYSENYVNGKRKQ